MKNEADKLETPSITKRLKGALDKYFYLYIAGYSAVLLGSTIHGSIKKIPLQLTLRRFNFMSGITLGAVAFIDKHNQYFDNKVIECEKKSDEIVNELFNNEQGVRDLGKKEFKESYLKLSQSAKESNLQAYEAVLRKTSKEKVFIQNIHEFNVAFYKYVLVKSFYNVSYDAYRSDIRSRNMQILNNTQLAYGFAGITVITSLFTEFYVKKKLEKKVNKLQLPTVKYIDSNKLNTATILRSSRIILFIEMIGGAALVGVSYTAFQTMELSNKVKKIDNRLSSLIESKNELKKLKSTTEFNEKAVMDIAKINLTALVENKRKKLKDRGIF